MKESLEDYNLLELITLKVHLKKECDRVDDLMLDLADESERFKPLEDELNKWGEVLHTVKLEIEKRL